MGTAQPLREPFPSREALQRTPHRYNPLGLRRVKTATTTSQGE
jgi:hypothetical protein